MSIYLDTRGRSSLGIGICARCKVKYPIGELRPDPNSPGLMCCPDGCIDQFDPWRLSPRQTDRLTLPVYRPDASLPVGPVDVPINPLQMVLTDSFGHAIVTDTGQKIAVAPPVSQINPSTPWGANQAVGIGFSVTVSNPVGFSAAGQTFYVFICLVPGTTGAIPPTWNSNYGAYTDDNTVIWICQGLYQP